jgi:lipopolysaccharide transport protein LptA
MRIFAIIFFAAGVWVSAAQTNTSTNGVDALLALVTTNHPAASHAGSPTLSRGPMKIDSDGPANFDFNRHWATYCDNVVVSDAQMKLTCEWLGANLPQNGERMTNIVAETNVIMDFVDEKGQQTRALGDKAVYYFHVEGGVTNETVTLTANPPGKPRIEQAQNTMTGDVIVWDRTTDQVHVTGNFRGEYWNTNSASGTNKDNPFLK